MYICKRWVVKGKVVILFKSLKTQVIILDRENLIFLSFKSISFYLGIFSFLEINSLLSEKTVCQYNIFLSARERLMTWFPRSNNFEAMKAGKLALWPWMFCQYNENTLMDLTSSVDISNCRNLKSS